MSNDIDGDKSKPGAEGGVSVWRHFLDVILMFESSPYFEGVSDYYDKRISSLEREVAELKSVAGQAPRDVAAS